LILTKENPQDKKNVDFPQQVSLSILEVSLLSIYESL